EELLVGTGYTPDQADALLLAMWNDGVRRAQKLEPKDRRDVAETLTALRRHLAAFRWTSANGSRTTLTRSRLLLMAPGTHGVVLDATGRLNNVYAGRPEQFEIRDVAPVRDYTTVTLHVARASGTGKTSAKTRGAKLADDTLRAITAHYGDQVKDRKV